jgi:hypothetical protein
VKECKECKTVYLDVESNFYKSERDGFQAICKMCKKNKDKDYYKRNRDKVKKRSSKYYEEHREERLGYYKEKL